MKYTSQNGVSVDVSPWCTEGHHKFTSLHLYEELGGSIGKGEMELVNDGSETALNMVDKTRTATITLEGPWNYTIPIYITGITSFRNSVSIQFICCPDIGFMTDLKQEVWEGKDITSIIGALYPGKQDVRCETDIQASDLVFWQSQESSYDLLVRLCSAFKRDSVFSLGWEGLMIKETMGKYDSGGNEEPYLKLLGGGDFQPIGADDFKYTPGLYDMPENVWEDKDGKVALQDYTDVEPRNLRVIKKYDSLQIMQTPYYQLEENISYNLAYQRSGLTRNIVLLNTVGMPKYKIGDVVEYTYVPMNSEGIGWPYKYYLVKSNEFFLAIDGSELTDDMGNKFSWKSKLIALEDNGKIALGGEEDPYKKEESK